MKKQNNKINYYRLRQAELHEEAIDWQRSLYDFIDYSYSEWQEFYEHFYTMGKRYGLLREFRNEGII